MNKKEDDFETLKDYNDYLEQVEEITSSSRSTSKPQKTGYGDGTSTRRQRSTPTPEDASSRPRCQPTTSC
jgi:hypothetical protein